MLLAIPSKGRAGQVKTTNIIKSATIFCPEYEAEYYKRSNPEQEIIGVPNNVKGITKTRNWILNYSDSKRVVMIDDDVKVQGWVKFQEHNTRHKKLNEQEWLTVINHLFDVIEDLGWKIFGISTQSGGRSVYTYHPILSRSYITASFMGIVNDGTYKFDEEFMVKEDYEIGLRHVKEFGGVLCARFCYWENNHWEKEGGCRDYRTGTIEEECIMKLMKKYPGLIRKITRGGSGYSIELDF